MKFAYADPPYLGCGKLYSKHHPDALAWDDPETHRRLIERLSDEYPDGWAMSLHMPSLRTLLPMCPVDSRVGAYCKTFAPFRLGVNPAYVWEPVIFRGGRKYTRAEPTVRDWHASPVALGRGLDGAKSREFCRWMFALLNAQRGDDLDDLYPGTGAVGAAWAEWVGEQSPLPRLPLEAFGAA